MKRRDLIRHLESHGCELLGKEAGILGGITPLLINAQQFPAIEKLMSI